MEHANGQRFYVCVRLSASAQTCVFVCGGALQVAGKASFVLGVRRGRLRPERAPRAKKYVFLLPLVLVVRLFGNSGDDSRKLPRSGIEDRLAKGVGQHRHHSLGQRKVAGRILETAGSTSDLKGQSTVCLPRREIDAIASLRKIGLQLTPILKAKYARTDNT
jgi:hypothetical protein